MRNVARREKTPSPAPAREGSGVVRSNRRIRRDETPAKIEAAPAPARRTWAAWWSAWRAGVRARIEAFWARVARPLTIALRVLAAIAVIAGSVAIYRLAEQHAHTSPAFAIVAIEVEGAERLDELEVSDQAGVVMGGNVFDVSPAEAQRLLLQHPWIASAEVQRRLPGSFHITIHEREAVAIVAAGGGWLLSSEGELFAPSDSSDAPADLPVITGIDAETVRRDRRAAARVLLDAVTLLSEWRGAGLWRREPIAEIHVEPDEGLSLYVGADALYVRLGRGPFQAKLGRLRRVLDELERREARPAYVYLDNVRRPDRVTVRVP